MPPTLLTVKQFAERHLAFSQASLRKLIFNAGARSCSINGRVCEIPGNGLEIALVRIGRRVLIDEREFFTWIEQQASRQPPQLGGRRSHA